MVTVPARDYNGAGRAVGVQNRERYGPGVRIRIYVVLSVIAFMLSIVLPELLRLPDLNAAVTPISAYLVGPYHWIEDIGFIVFAVALIVIAMVELAGFAQALALVVAFAVLATFVTRVWMGAFGVYSLMAHLASAALAFSAFFGLELAASHGALLWCLTAAYPVSVGAVYLAAPQASAWQEKTAVALICAWLIAFAVVGARDRFKRDCVG